MSIADEGKGLSQWGGDLINDFVDYSVRQKISLTCLILSRKSLYPILFSKFYVSVSQRSFCADGNKFGKCTT